MINNYQSSQGSQGEPARNVDVNFLWSKLASLVKSNQLRNMATVYVSIDGGPAFPVKAVRAAHDGSHAILAAYPEHTDISQVVSSQSANSGGYGSGQLSMGHEAAKLLLDTRSLARMALLHWKRNDGASLGETMDQLQKILN